MVEAGTVFEDFYGFLLSYDTEYYMQTLLYFILHSSVHKLEKNDLSVTIIVLGDFYGCPQPCKCKWSHLSSMTLVSYQIHKDLSTDTTLTVL